MSCEPDQIRNLKNSGYNQIEWTSPDSDSNTEDTANDKFEKILTCYDLLSNVLDRNLIGPKQRYDLGKTMVDIAKLFEIDTSVITRAVLDNKDFIKQEHQNENPSVINDIASQMALLSILNEKF